LTVITNEVGSDWYAKFDSISEPLSCLHPLPKTHHPFDSPTRVPLRSHSLLEDGPNTLYSCTARHIRSLDRFVGPDGSVTVSNEQIFQPSVRAQACSALNSAHKTLGTKTGGTILFPRFAPSVRGEVVVATHSWLFAAAIAFPSMIRPPAVPTCSVITACELIDQYLRVVVSLQPKAKSPSLVRAWEHPVAGYL
jgi:hypothetical protein